MLTYETLSLLANKEKNSMQLNALPPDFFFLARDYLEKKSQIRTKEDAWELDAAKRLLSTITEKRETKIVRGALDFARTGAKLDNMTKEEYSFFNSLVELIKSWQSKQQTVMEQKPEPKEIVAFLGELPQFVGIDMKEYGPFRMGDIATIPQKNAEVLIGKGLAKALKA